MDYIIVIVLVALSGLFSGLTLGLLSLDKNELKRKIELGDKYAEKVYPVRKKGNLLLCTLLLGNVAVNSTLAIFLGNIASGVMAGIIATALIVVFGEIIPQASFSRFALQVGAKTAWLVKIFMYLLFPICFPIAWVLDKVLGDEMATIYSKHELMKIVEEHESAKESEIESDETRIIKGALTFSDKIVEKIMTPRTMVYAIEKDEILDHKKLDEMRKLGFSRYPVYEKEIDNVIGVIFIKDLINIQKGIKADTICDKNKFLLATEDMTLDDLLDKFIKTKKHLAFVKDEYGGLSGVVCLEDVLEEIIKVEIVDEDDKVVDLRKAAKQRTKK